MHHSQVHTNQDIKKEIKKDKNSTLKIYNRTLQVCLILVYMLIKQKSWVLPSYFVMVYIESVIEFGSIYLISKVHCMFIFDSS